MNSVATDSMKSNASMKSNNPDAKMSYDSFGPAKELNIDKMNLEMTVMHNSAVSMNSNTSMKSRGNE